LLKKGKSNSVYNICSGNGIMLKEIIETMSKLLNIKIITQTNPALIRPNENRKIIGSYKKMKTDFGWTPQITLEQSLTDIINYWKAN
jgi:GDP-4-dehydro-6-deoxy-D-mannose reductase